MTASNDAHLSEQYVQDAFHTYLKSSLTQAKVEKLVDADLLSSAESDVMITGPALCLYFAALSCTTDPPSVPLPSGPNMSLDNCPPTFSRFMRLWASTVPLIQALSPNNQNNLARIICNLPPLRDPSDPFSAVLSTIAADLRAIAIEISQRRSFQDRYAGDLQAAIDAGQTNSGLRPRASFVPPPSYDPSSSPFSSPIRLRTPTPTILTEDAPAIEFVRETLYAALYDVLSAHQSIRTLLHTDPAHAYFASVSLAILHVSLTSVTPHGSVIGVLRQELEVGQCPDELKPFMVALGQIGKEALKVEEEDTTEAIRLAERGGDIPVPRMERVKAMLEKGVGHDGGQVVLEHVGFEGTFADARIGNEDENGRETRNAVWSVVAFANRVNALSLGLTRLPAFRERQDEVFRVLGGSG